MVRVPSQKQLEDYFIPYATELGYLVYSWNRLQLRLTDLFWDAIGTRTPEVPRAIWYTITVDRAQRQMLLAAAMVAQFKNPRARDDIKWIIDHAEKFEDKRNNAIHSPFTLMTSASGTTLAAADYTGHPRAKKLKDKELLSEFRWCAETAAILANFAARIHTCLTQPNVEWPERPQLPQLQKSATTKKHQR